MEISDDENQFSLLFFLFPPLIIDIKASWVGGLMPLAGLAGGIIGGPLIEYLGRRNTILFTAVPFIISWLLIALATNIGLVLAGETFLFHNN